MLFFHVKKPIEEISPFWLLFAIACNSSGIITVELWELRALTDRMFLDFAFGFWTFGVTIYFIFMTLNIYRMFFLPFQGKDLHPAYWTCMGAAAIAVYDGSRLLLLHDPSLFIVSVKPFLAGSTLVLWMWATAWIPILLLMGIWKHFYFKLPFTYIPALWAIVFPLGMYTLATHIIPESAQLYGVSKAVPFWLGVTVFAWIVFATRGLFQLKSYLSMKYLLKRK